MVIKNYHIKNCCFLLGLAKISNNKYREPNMFQIKTTLRFCKTIFQSALIIGFVSFSTSLQAKTEEASWVIIHAGKLISDAREKTLSEQSIIVKNDLITDILPGYVTADDLEQVEAAQIVDLKDKFVMPGLIDLHTHLTLAIDGNRMVKAVTETTAHTAIFGVKSAEHTVKAGFTTVRNLGGDREAIFALRDSINKGTIPGPRVLAAGYAISALGGHGDTNGFKPGLIPAHSGVCNGADDCRRAVRDQIKNGADVIKITATGGVLSNTATGTGQQLTFEELKAIVDTAHSMGRTVAAHAHGADGINAALRAGVDSIEHGTYLNKETIKLFKKTGAYLVPTVLAGETVAQMAEIEGFLPRKVVPKALRVGPQMLAMLRRAHEAGVKIATGSDSGVSAHGDNGQELYLMVKAGMSEKDVLIASTVSAADMLGLSEEIGTIEAGKSADIIASKQNPLDDIKTLLNPKFVMARGRIVKEGKS